MNKEKKWRFNVIDVLFLLVVLAGIGFLALRLLGPSDASVQQGDPDDYYVVTYSGDAVANYVLDHVRLNAPVSDNSATRDLGTVVDIQLASSVYYQTDQTGQMVESSLDDFQSIRLMCLARGAANGFTLTVDGVSMNIGNSLVVRTEEAKMYLTVYDIQKLGDTGYTLPAVD